MQGVTTATWLLLQPKQPANRWLALLLAGLTFQVIDYFLSRSGIYYRNRWLYFTPLFFSWGFGPLLYGYVQARLGKTNNLSWRHFIPVAVQLLFYLILVFQPLTTKAWFWLTVHKPYTRYVEYYAGCLLMLYYVHLSRKIIRQADTPVSWLKHTLRGAGLFYVIAMIDPLVNSIYLSPKDPKFFLTAQLLPFFVYTAALVGRSYKRREDPVRQQLTIPVKSEHQEQIRQAIQDNRLYQDSELTLASLSAQVGLSPNVISRTINAGFGQSFTDYINTYRVEEVKRRLESGDAERVTFLALAFEAGFSSKTTFNRVFKEQTGYTPKEYQNMVPKYDSGRH
ncbi:AraC family transcriptional regulator [Spirosoma sp. KNUC1025]|uniref:helix-turn-helix domain-containing protein n=1 Tax=Spirosoma sp. KNUC1025 TaxID=2894082 RepID=UPI0038653409|nr:AraC family transcriptional regulator [Spirosoma sp. KNUC1025]